MAANKLSYYIICLDCLLSLARNKTLYLKTYRCGLKVCLHVKNVNNLEYVLLKQLFKLNETSDTHELCNIDCKLPALAKYISHIYHRYTNINVFW